MTGLAPRLAIGVDGQALSGSAHRTQRHRHLLPGVTDAPTVTLAQQEVGAVTNETATFRPLLKSLNLAGAVITASPTAPSCARQVACAVSRMRCRRDRRCSVGLRRHSTRCF